MYYKKKNASCLHLLYVSEKQKSKFNLWATSLVDIPAVTMPIACSPKPATFVALCCVLNLHILQWPCIVDSLRHTCAIVMLATG